MKTKGNKFRVILEVWDENDIPYLSIPEEYSTETIVYEDIDEKTLFQILKDNFEKILQAFYEREKNKND